MSSYATLLCSRFVRFVAIAFATQFIAWSAAVAADPEPQHLSGADGALQLDVPASWQPKQPAVNLIEHEFVVPPAEGDTASGRVTTMQAGGSIQANVDRWKGQFKLAGDQAAKTDTLEVNELKIHRVDLRGTFLDRPRPFGPGTPRENYRMLGAVVETKANGLYFIKFYGPAKTVDQEEKHFDEMLHSIKTKQ